MQRTGRFIFHVSTEERHLIADLAERLQRTQSDVVRFVTVNATCELAGKYDTYVNQPQRAAIITYRALEEDGLDSLSSTGKLMEAQ
jgi:hypothetical protein